MKRLSLPVPALVTLLALMALPLAAACGSSGTDTPVGPVFAMTFDPSGPLMTLTRDDQVLASFPADGLQLGTVAELDDECNYDPFPLEVPNDVFEYTPPEGLQWRNMTAAVLHQGQDGGATVDLTFDGDIPATLVITPRSGHHWDFTLTPQGGVVAYFRLRARVDTTEEYYGLGAYLDQVTHRGTKRAMQFEMDLDLESGYNEAHVPVPFVIGSKGWGLLVTSVYPGIFDVAADEADVVEATFGTGLDSELGITFHLFADLRPLDITKYYYDVTGYPRLPAPWALGPWIWRDESLNQAEVISDVNTIRDLDLATTGYWIDRPYATGVNTFDFSPALFTDPQDMIDQVHALGFRMALWHTPYAGDSREPATQYHDYAESNGYFPPKTGLLLNKWSKPMDFTNTAAYDWWQGNIMKYIGMGIEGFKLDYGEDIVPGLMGARNVWQFHNGQDERTMHYGYTLLYHQVYAQTLPADGGFLLCRTAKWGDQANGPIIWPGDLDADFSTHRQSMVDKDGEHYVAVGGVPASLYYGMGLGPSGFAFYGADTGGYRHSPPDKETFTRWFEVTALSSVMQVGTSTNDVAWEYDDENLFDDEMLGWYRTYTRLHLRLFAYEWTYAKNLAIDGRAIQRPLGLVYPEAGHHVSDHFLFGDHLLAAPVVARDQRTKDVIFPGGSWVDWWTGQVHQGKQTVTVDAPLGVLPLYQQAGSVVPLLRPTIDTVAPTTAPERVDSLATDPGLLYPRVVLGAASSFTVYDGTKLSQTGGATSATLGYEPGSLFTKGVVFEVVAFGAAPAAVKADGAALTAYSDLTSLEAAAQGYCHVADAMGGTLWVKLAAQGREVSISR